jgi:hypothetical protein
MSRVYCTLHVRPPLLPGLHLPLEGNSGSPRFSLKPLDELSTRTYPSGTRGVRGASSGCAELKARVAEEDPSAPDFMAVCYTAYPSTKATPARLPSTVPAAAPKRLE